MQRQTDEKFMRIALTKALESKESGDYAIGAVIVYEGKVISAVGNTRNEHPIDPTSHTEVVAIKQACEHLRSRYLEKCTLYSTHAPCLMCLGTCIWSCVGRVVYGIKQADIMEHSKKHGFHAGKKTKLKWRATCIEPEELYPYVESAHPDMDITSGILRKECLKLFK